jgi:hypothetical protein
MKLKNILKTTGALHILLGLLIIFLLIFSVETIAVALFNTFNAGTIVDGGPPPPFWIVLIANPLLCIYGLNKANKWNAY